VNSFRFYLFAAAMIAIVLVFMIFALAWASSCNAIRDFDKRAACLALLTTSCAMRATTSFPSFDSARETDSIRAREAHSL
jgi:hypothetical protein